MANTEDSVSCPKGQVMREGRCVSKPNHLKHAAVIAGGVGLAAGVGALTHHFAKKVGQRADHSIAKHKQTMARMDAQNAKLDRDIAELERNKTNPNKPANPN